MTNQREKAKSVEIFRTFSFGVVMKNSNDFSRNDAIVFIDG